MGGGASSTVAPPSATELDTFKDLCRRYGVDPNAISSYGEADAIAFNQVKQQWNESVEPSSPGRPRGRGNADRGPVATVVSLLRSLHGAKQRLKNATGKCRVFAAFIKTHDTLSTLLAAEESADSAGGGGGGSKGGIRGGDGGNNGNANVKDGSGVGGSSSVGAQGSVGVPGSFTGLAITTSGTSSNDADELARSPRAAAYQVAEVSSSRSSQGHVGEHRPGNHGPLDDSKDNYESTGGSGDVDDPDGGDRGGAQDAG